jgi:integrase
MAQVLKRNGSPFYYARFQLRGEDHVISTKKRTKPEAEQELERLMAEAKGELTITDQLKTLLRLIEQLPADHQAGKRQDVAREILRDQDRKVAVANGFSAWRGNANKEYDPKASTLLGYEAIWKRFQKWAEASKVTFLHEVTREHAEDYAGDLWKAKVSPSTFNQHVKFLRAVFTALETKAGLVGNVWTHLKTKKKKLDEGRRNLTEAELETILTRAQGNLRAMLHIGLFTGLRLGDVVNLRWDNIDFTRGFVVVVPLKTRRFNKKVEVPLHHALTRLLAESKARANGSDYLFPSERIEYLDNASNITAPIQEFFESCGIKTTEQAEDGQRRRAIIRVGFHSLRHSFVSLCAKARTPQHVVQKLVGHGSPAMTEHYTHLDAEQKQEAIAALPDIGARAFLLEQGPKEAA